MALKLQAGPAALTDKNRIQKHDQKNNLDIDGGRFFGFPFLGTNATT